MHGMRRALHYISACAGLNIILLVIGIMDFPAMALVTVAITAERLAPSGARVARAIGLIVAATGLFLIAKGFRLHCLNY
jgi:predicted metal-binding membrane protein